MEIYADKKQQAHEIALGLLEIGAVKLRPSQPFKWASGWNSPIYCDNRLALSFPPLRNQMKLFMSGYIQQMYPEAQVVAGVATAGIPLGVLVADVLELPFIYVRPKPKEHGMSNLIEGKLDKLQKVVVVEDLISTGGSSLKAVAAIREAGAEVLGMIGIFSYGFEAAKQNFMLSGVNLHTLSDYHQLLKTGVEKGYINVTQIQSLEHWRNSPDTWVAQ